MIVALVSLTFICVLVAVLSLGYFLVLVEDGESR